MSYSTEYIEELLEEKGELIAVMESDGYGNNPELHLHDTTFDHAEGRIVLGLADGEVVLEADSIETLAYHEQTTEELGI